MHSIFCLDLMTAQQDPRLAAFIAQARAEGLRQVLAARQSASAPYFVAVVGSDAVRDRIAMSSGAANRLGAAPGDRVWALSLAPGSG